MMAILSRLFGRNAQEKSTPEPATYKDFRIFPEPQSAPGGYRTAARIEKEVGGETKVHHLLRADTLQSAAEAEAFAVRKAKQVIDEQGDALFR